MLLSEIQKLPTDPLVRVFPGFGNFSFKMPFLGRISIPTSFVSIFMFYILSYLFSKTMGCLSGCLISSASIQKLFCRICSACKYSFDECVGEKVVSPSYSSAILGLPPGDCLTNYQTQQSHFWAYTLRNPQFKKHMCPDVR